MFKNRKDRVVVIYKITCMINGKTYIGKTEDLIKYRWSVHCACSRVEEKRVYPLYKEMYEYGIDNFKLEILQESRWLRDPSWRSKLEKYWMFVNNSIYPNGYNLQPISARYMSYIKNRLKRENKIVDKCQ
jgi:group I intron endonuclease